MEGTEQRRKAPAGLAIGRIVIYRSRTGDYDVPAIVNCTVDTISPKGVELGHVPELSSEEHVHLTVLTPGKPGMRRDAADFKEESPHGRSENVRRLLPGVGYCPRNERGKTRAGELPLARPGRALIGSAGFCLV